MNTDLLCKFLLLSYDEFTVYDFVETENESFFQYCSVFRLHLPDGVRLVFVPDSKFVEFKEFVDKNKLSYYSILDV